MSGHEEATEWIREAVIALDAATIIGQRSCSEGDHLHYANHDRLVASAPPLIEALRSTPAPVESGTVAVPAAEWEALREAVDDDSGTVANYRANVTGRAAALVRAWRREQSR